MPNCGDCGTETNALHSGGDAGIPPPGVCDRCQVVRSRVAIAGRELDIADRVKKRLAAAKGA